MGYKSWITVQCNHNERYIIEAHISSKAKCFTMIWQLYVNHHFTKKLRSFLILCKPLIKVACLHKVPGSNLLLTYVSDASIDDWGPKLTAYLFLIFRSTFKNAFNKKWCSSWSNSFQRSSTFCCNFFCYHHLHDMAFSSLYSRNLLLQLLYLKLGQFIKNG